MRVNVIVDVGLIGGAQFRELNPHAHAAVGPRDRGFGLDVVFRRRHTKANFHRGADCQRTGRANRKALRG
jgi:hypothetical protein